ncbi:MAG: hypothetical protein H7Y17_00610, partial [Chlorobia bacterium]|nr:hypothetical protein [Fimbriimonadaceae bacterium]
YNKQLQEVQKTSATEEAMTFSGISKKIQDSIQAMYKSAQQNNGQPDMQVSSEIREILINPDKNEPLSFVATDAIFETSRIKGLNIVCSATDMMMFGTGVIAEGAAKPATFLASMNGLMMESEIKDGWLVLKPQVASSARAQRSDRFVLGQYLRQAVKEGRVSLDNRATFAFRSGKEEEDFMPMFLLSMVGILRQGMEYGGDWDTLRLFGSLTPHQRQAAKTGQPVPFRALQPAQLDIMRHVVFDSPWPRLQINYQQEDFADMQSDEGIIYGGGLDSEPTEVLPNGFTGTELLTIRETNEPKFFGRPESDGSNQMTYWGESAYDANGLAHELFQSERPEFFPWRNQPGYPRGKLAKVRVGTQRQFSFMAQFTRRATLNLNLTDKNYQGEAMEISKLPPDVKKQIEDALARIREQYKNAKPPTWNPGNGGGNIPPPP